MATATGVSGKDLFTNRTDEALAHLKETGQFKMLQTIEGPMDATVRLRGYGEVGCFCSNNYLGLANHPQVKRAGIEGIEKFGAGNLHRCPSVQSGKIHGADGEPPGIGGQAARAVEIFQHVMAQSS